MQILKEFKAFAMKGNVLDLAIGVIIGGAFGKIVSSLVADVIMPPLGFILGGIDFSTLAVTLRAATETDPALVLSYGKFIQATVDFVIIAAAVFTAVKAMNALKRKEEAAPAEPPKPSPEVVLLTEIRDALKK